MCPGKGYARLVILVFMHHMVRRFNWEKIVPDEKILVDPQPYPEKVYQSTFTLTRLRQDN